MKRSVWLLVLAVALAGLNVPVQAGRGKEPRGDRQARSDPLGQYALMAKVLNFTDDQKAELTETLAACAADVEMRQEINARRFARLKEKLAEARKKNDKDAMRAIAEQYKAIQADEAKRRDVAATVVMEILTAEQKRQWAGFAVYRQIMPRFKKVVLTEVQDKKVRDMCTAKAKDIPAADAEAKADAYEDLAAAIIKSVLTAEQQETITGRKPGDGRKPDKRAKSNLRGEYAVMARVLNFTDAQATELVDTLKARADTARKWQEDNADKIAEFRKQLIEARQNRDKDALRKVSEQYKALRAGEPKSRGVAMDLVTEIMTSEQKRQWAGYTVYRKVTSGRSFRRAGLTDEQDKKVRDMCTAKAKDLLAGDKKARAEAHRDLMAAIMENVLTAEQKEKLTGKKSRKDKDEKKELRKDKKKTARAPDATT